MTDYISKKAAKKIIEDIDTWCAGWRDYACKMLDDLPAADVVERQLYDRALSNVVRLSVEREERKKGKWINRPKEPKHRDWYTCSECKGQFDYEWHFCPNCGADMREES